MKQIKMLIILLLTTVYTVAGFNFGECSGEGTFQQQIEAYNGDKEKTVLVGEIPVGIEGLYIELLSDKDVDIRLYGPNDDKIVHWPSGLLNKWYKSRITYHDTIVTYSGFNGVNKQKGHEYIRVDGATPVKFTMKAFGYEAGYATVNYHWTGKVGCEVNTKGTGQFKQSVRKKETVLVGTIPANLDNLEINLTSNKDIDIQLYGADGTAIVSWKPKGLLSGSTKQTIEYHGMTITWSGFNGVNGESGHEYIKVIESSTEMLTMKVYGYDEGFADVTYSWGEIDAKAPETPSLSQTPSSTTNNSESISITGEVGTSVWINGVNVGTIDSSGTLAVTLDTTGDTGTKTFSIVLKDDANNESTAMVVNIVKLVEDIANMYGIASQGTVDSNYQYFSAAKNVLDHNASTWNHTRNSVAQNWVQVALNTPANISKIMVKGGLSGHAYRLKNAKVYLSTTPFISVDALKESDVVATLKGTIEDQWINLDAKQGQYIIVKANGAEFLHIASIEAYGVMNSVVDTIELANESGFATQGTKPGVLYYQTANNVLDHNTSTWNHTTSGDSNNWLQVALISPSNISKIKIVGGFSAHSYRLKDAKVYLSDTPYTGVEDIDEKDLIMTLKAGISDQWIHFETHKQGQYLFVKAKGSNYLHLASVEVYGFNNESSTAIDLAHEYGIATQGTTQSDYIYFNPAGYVLDHKDTTWNHTRDGSVENWIQVDLGANANISKLKVKVGLPAHAYRLKDAKVYLSESPYTNNGVLNEKDVIGVLKDTSSDQWFEFDTHKQGRYIIIKQKAGNFLHIASIEAYGVIDKTNLVLDTDDLAYTYGIASQGTTNTNYIYYRPANNVLDHNISIWNHTSNNQNDNWVQVNLGSIANISKIKVNVGLPAFAYRLSGAKVYVSDVPVSSADALKENDVVAELSGTTADQWFDLSQHRQGQYIIIKAQGGNFLHISSIEAYGRMVLNEKQKGDIDIASKYGIATQGTTDSEYIYFRPAKNVLDHNASTWNHTRNSTAENWVQVELPSTSRIKKIKVQIGLTGFASRLKDAKVYVLAKRYNKGDELNDGDIVGTLKNTPYAQWFNLDMPKQGQYLLIKGAGGDFLHIAKFEAYGVINVDNKVDLAHAYGTATQGTAEGYQYYQVPSKAIDGNDDTFNHTRNSKTENWVQVAFDADINIEKMKIKVGLNTWASRLEGAEVYMLDTAYQKGDSLENETPIATLKGTSYSQWFNFDSAVQGRYLLIKAKGSNYLHIASIELYGSATKTPVIKTHQSDFLIPQATATSTDLVQLETVDYQGNIVSYSIVSDVPFSIDNNGLIKTNGVLSPNTTYEIKVKVTDGTHEEFTIVKVKTTDANAVENALNSGSVTDITEIELLDAAIAESSNSSENESITTLLNHIKNKDYNFDWSVCHESYYVNLVGEDYQECGAVVGLRSEFEDGLKNLRNKIRALDGAKTRLFPVNTHKLEAILVLLADKYRETIRYPMDKIRSGMTRFAKSSLADSAVYNYRNLSPAQKDMGNFSSSDFSHITPTTKIMEYKSRKYFGAAGVYAIPGKTVKITRLDNSDLTIKIFINTLRRGATHDYARNGYNRPTYLQTVGYSIASGETLEITSTHGGPIQIYYTANDLDVKLKFENIGEHAFWRSPADNESFAAKLAAKEYNWAEISTSGFEVHSKIDKMITSVSRDNWGGTAEGLANAVKKYTSNYPHVLAGFKGEGIDVVPEIHDWANERGITIEAVNFKKHMNADQAACGGGCSGNPYDAYWAFNPIGHGDIHELGHNLQAMRFEGFSNHAATNPYAYYTQSKYHENTGESAGCQGLPFKEFYETLQEASKQDDIVKYMRENLWEGHGEQLGARYIFKISAYMHAQKMGKLINGWHVLARVHILQREMKRAKLDWENRKDAVGFSTYSLSEYQSTSTNDWLTIAYSYAAQIDFTDYFDMMGIPYSDKARAQIESFGFDKAPATYFVSTNQGYCSDDDYGVRLDRPTVPVDGTTQYPY